MAGESAVPGGQLHPRLDGTGSRAQLKSDASACGDAVNNNQPQEVVLALSLHPEAVDIPADSVQRKPGRRLRQFQRRLNPPGEP